MELDIITRAFHRNGVGGAPFNVYIAKDDEGDTKLIVAFDDKECTAVFSLERLAHGDIEFGSNSWRGDVYRWALDQALETAN